MGLKRQEIRDSSEFSVTRQQQLPDDGLERVRGTRNTAVSTPQRPLVSDYGQLS